ncbi:C4-dicarboxylate ABC transporter substrate-binding protein [Siccirubricoccus deserti]|uniref:TRAP transporter substrate-binding protein n=1 Tax=Siccirubricoccus deserti TaxID=2013562 RepID=A0A9X0R0K6_9PROT|nr:TRAP transporter substrate-binding protein [Siccirubricoccus deserti]MBC4016643.1 TRAP transporter substrate-binding protein [Siccirubricoccus deserti]GGC50718.1 C4-dicarboxylate ABC transporter substrate-binding protein [Siccirubricoccus deserti]
MSLITRRGLGAATLLSGLAPAVLRAQQKTVLRLGWTSGDGANDPYAAGARAFQKALAARVGDRIEVQLYPNRAIGDERPMLDGMRLGTVDMGVITNAVIAQIEQAFQLVDMPFLFGSEAQAHQVLDGNVGEQLRQKLDAKGVIPIGYMEGGFRHMINNVRPVVKPEDLQGIKFRVLQSPIFIEMYRSLGGNAVPMAWGETFTAVQQGAIDGLEIPLGVIDQNKYYEVTKYLSLTGHIYSMNGLLISKRSFGRLPADLKAAVTEAGAEATREQRRSNAAAQAAFRESLARNGMQVNEVPDKAAFRRAVMPMYERFRAQIGADIVRDALAAVQ